MDVASDLPRFDPEQPAHRIYILRIPLETTDIIQITDERAHMRPALFRQTDRRL